MKDELAGWRLALAMPNTWRIVRRIGAVSFAIGMAVVASGCSETNLLGALTGPATGSAPPMRATSQVTLVALRPIIGPPAAVSEGVARQLNEAASPKNIALVIDSEIKSQYALSGYMHAARAGAQVKLIYVFDVFDQDGTRINRIEGEDVFVDRSTTDVWGHVPQTSIDAITAKVIAALPAGKPS